MGKNGKKYVALIIILAITVMSVASSVMGATTLKKGSKGKDVEAVQKVLKKWGYYTGKIDGNFGPATREAVIRFQKKNKLKADGVVGSATAKAMGITLSGGGKDSKGTATNIDTSSNLYLLAKVVYGEARGEPYKGQVAVAAVVLNRVDSASFPNSISGVVYQSGAFDAVSDGQINLSPDESAIKAAKDAMNGYDPTNGCIYYYNPQTATSKWIRSREIMLTIGRHVFCK